MDAADIFQSLGVGIKFDQKRFGRDVALFKRGSGTAGPNEIPNGAKGPTAKKDQLKSAEDGPARDQQVSGTKEEDDDLEEVELFSRAAKAELEGGEKASPFIDAVTGPDCPPPLRNFDELHNAGDESIAARLLGNMAAAGFHRPTPIQSQAIPCLLAGRDLLAIAPTGSGKTLAFLIPALLLARRLKRARPATPPGVKALVLTPTRELTAQSARVLGLLLPGLGLRASILTRATARRGDFARVDVLLANPLRLVEAVDPGTAGEMRARIAQATEAKAERKRRRKERVLKKKDKAAKKRQRQALRRAGLAEEAEAGRDAEESEEEAWSSDDEEEEVDDDDDDEGSDDGESGDEEGSEADDDQASDNSSEADDQDSEADSEDSKDIHTPDDSAGRNASKLGAEPQRPALDLSQLRLLILDEADKLFDLGFTPQVDAILAKAPHPQLARAFFSATLPDAVETLARSVMPDPLRVTVGRRGGAAQSVAQRLKFVGREAGKPLALRQLLRSGELRPPVLVFVDSRDRASRVHEGLRLDGLRAGLISAGQSDAQREEAVAAFRKGATWVLIATDLLGRGMDFPGVNAVVNYDCPRTTIDYIHRIGRTGRAGRTGTAVTFFTEDDAPKLHALANVIKHAGSDVPAWMFGLEKEDKRRKKRDGKSGGAKDGAARRGKPAGRGRGGRGGRVERVTARKSSSNLPRKLGARKPIAKGKRGGGRGRGRGAGGPRRPAK